MFSSIDSVIRNLLNTKVPFLAFWYVGLLSLRLLLRKHKLLGVTDGPAGWNGYVHHLCGIFISPTTGVKLTKSLTVSSYSLINCACMIKVTSIARR